ncbi:unnamed protein product [Rhizophagus irregularis]|uniref:Uncharacterized protein n=1 Tax=Rhizophagus irregularis TaxID=588596 RepID=A0A915ZUE2_9GLOM|nr:unnamed protein product [Rhizophagus irregularis]CAB5387518.1 unnamed protein product [Rhizophagus irregularis]
MWILTIVRESLFISINTARFEPPIAPIAAPKLLLKKLPKVPKPAAPIDCKIETRFPRAIVSPYNDINQEEMNLLQCPTPNPNPYIIADKIIGATNAPTNPIAMFQ